MGKIFGSRELDGLRRLIDLFVFRSFSLSVLLCLLMSLTALTLGVTFLLLLLFLEFSSFLLSCTVI